MSSASDVSIDSRILYRASMLKSRVLLGVILALGSALPDRTMGGGEVGSWSNNGPEGVSSPDLVFDGVNASVAYLQTGPDLFKTVNAGETWTRILALGGSPAVAPTNPRVLFTTTYYRDLARSEDGGESWTMFPGPELPEFAQGVSNYQLVFDAQDPNVVFLAQQIQYRNIYYVGAVYKSADGGRTWSSLLRDGGYNPHLAADSKGVWVLWSSLINFPGILDRIPGDGSSIRTVTVPFGVRSFALDPSDPANLYVGADEGLVRSRDAGQTWTLVPLRGPVFVVQVNPADPSEILARDRVGLIRSTDFGATWNPFSLAPVTFLAFDPFDSSILYGTLESQLVRTANRGAEWSTIVKGLATTSVSTIAADIGLSGRLYAAAGADVFRTNDGGDSWSLLGSVPGVQRINALAFSSASGLLLAGTRPNGLVTTSDDGGTWRVLGLTADFIAVAPADDRILYAGGVGEDEQLFRSRDGGITWTHLVGFEPGTLAVDPRNPDLLYANGFTKSAAGLFKSTDGGSSWSLMKDDRGGGPIVVDPHDPRKLYTRFFSGFFRSLDAGLSWERTGSFDLVGSIVAHPLVPGLLFLYDYERSIYSSNDFGASWDLFPTPRDLDGSPVLAIDAGGKTLHATSVSSGVYSYRFIEARAPIGPRVSPRSDRRVPFRP
jgi:photosystem II stability/assembly factor-like uncharacterized protein